MKNNFYIMRHGTTSYQTVRRRFVYPKTGDVGLTNSGRRLVKESAKKLKGIDAIYASDFRRAKETALLAAQVIDFPKEKIVYTKELRDVNLGVYHGGLKESFYEDFPDFHKELSQKPKGGESLIDVRERLLSCLNKIDEREKGKTILIVSHGEPLWLLEGAIKKRELLKRDGTKKHYISPGEIRKLN